MASRDDRDNRGRPRIQRERRGRSQGGRGPRSSYDEHKSKKGLWDSIRESPLLVFLAFLFGIVVLRLVMLQVFDSARLTQTAESNQVDSGVIMAKRGTIYDRNGNVLATSVDCSDICVNPSMVSDKNAAANLFAEKLGGKASDYLTTLSKDTTYAVVAKNVDQDIADDLESSLTEEQSTVIWLDAKVKRVYPYGSVAGQIIGMVGDDGNGGTKGLTGLELQYNDVLSGTDGSKYVERGSNGQPVAGGTYVINEAEDGQDIIISLDVNIQRVAEEQLTQAVKDASGESGNCIVTEPKTGEILAACSLPLADLTDTSSLTNKALNLTSVSSSYEPGSTFKIITMAIGYETGTITKNSTFTVPASVKVGDDDVTDSDGRDYTMVMTPTEIMRRSSNTGAAMVGMAIGADKFAEGVAKFGIGSTTGIDFPGEVAGLVPTRDQYNGATTGSAAFGQGIAFPSIQTVRAVGAIANKGTMVTPHFLVQKGSEKVDWGEGTQVVSEETAENVIGDMRAVVQDDGTGAAANIAGYDVVGKTGTGEQASSEGGYVEDSFLSSFVGFANGEDASVLCYVGIYGTAQHGSTAAVPPFTVIMNEALTDLSVPKS